MVWDISWMDILAAAGLRASSACRERSIFAFLLSRAESIFISGPNFLAESNQIPYVPFLVQSPCVNYIVITIKYMHIVIKFGITSELFGCSITSMLYCSCFVFHNKKKGKTRKKIHYTFLTAIYF